MPENDPGTLEIFETPVDWAGTIWARTKCSNNETFYFSCETGDCGSGIMDCQSPLPAYPVTLLNFIIKGSEVSYEVDLNHGYNVPVRIRPIGGTLVGRSSPCPVVDCIKDLTEVCPGSLIATNKQGWAVGCFSPCDGYKDPKYCCSGSFTGSACQPNQYSQAFKQLCSLAHTYPGDMDPPVYKCSGATSYNITFCPM